MLSTMVHLEDVGHFQIVSLVDDEALNHLNSFYFCHMLGDELEQIEIVVEQDLQDEIVASGDNRCRQDSRQPAEVISFSGNVEIGEFYSEIEKAVPFQAFGVDIAGEVEDALCTEFVDAGTDGIFSNVEGIGDFFERFPSFFEMPYDIKIKLIDEHGGLSESVGL